jgi:hypothetical protein
VFLITFSKAGQEDIVLTEDDLFDFQYEASCYSGESFELGGVNAKTLYLLIDNNTQRFSRGTFANCRVKLEIDGKFFGYYNTELPKRRNGVIELTAYDDMVKLGTEFPTDYTFPQTFWAVYAQCVFEAGLASEVSFDNVVLNGVWDNGIISADYTQYIYANSCRNLVAGMAEWNGGFAYINDDNKLQIDKFSKTVTREYSSGDLMELDYSDETVVFSKVKTSQKNKTYEMGTDAGYTLVLKNQYISYGLDDTMFETYLTKISEYYTGFELTPMSFTLAEPDFDLHVGDRIQVYDEEEQVAITGNVSKIAISGNCSMTVTCGGFENVSSSSGFTPTSYSQIQQSKQEAKTSSQTTGGTLNEYKYLTDASVKFNGTTYTIEKDAETGLISKISDSAGNEFEPEISAGITDVAMHNAVFWAVAMMSGFSSSTPLGAFAEFVMDGVDLSKRRWYNRLGSDYMELSTNIPNPDAMSTGSLLLTGYNQTAVYACDDPAAAYIIFKNVTPGYYKDKYGHTKDYWAPVLCRWGAAGYIGVQSAIVYVDGGTVRATNKNYSYVIGDATDDGITTNVLDSNIVSDIWHIACLTRDSANNIKFYVDGTLIGTICTLNARDISEYHGCYIINVSASAGGRAALGWGANAYRYAAFCNVCHNDAQVREYSLRLLSKYAK